MNRTLETAKIFLHNLLENGIAYSIAISRTREAFNLTEKEEEKLKELEYDY